MQDCGIEATGASLPVYIDADEEILQSDNAHTGRLLDLVNFFVWIRYGR